MGQMPEFDYHKVVSIIARTLNVESDISLVPVKGNLNLFDVSFSDKNGQKVECRIINDKFKLEVKIRKSYFDEKKFQRWIRDFEYELEQAFLSNIKVSVDQDEAADYRITLSS